MGEGQPAPIRRDGRPLFICLAGRDLPGAAFRVVNRHAPQIVTAEYKIVKRPAGRVLVDYNQNAWGRTLASVYSVRAKPAASVSTPVTWQEVEQGIAIDDFTLENVPERIEEVGDLWKPVLSSRGRFDLSPYL